MKRRCLLPATLLLPLLLLTGCPHGQRPNHRPPTGPDSTQIQQVVQDLFDAYDSEDVQGYLYLVDREFTGQDRTGNAYRRADLPRALRDDFQVMERIRFEAVRVSNPMVRADEGVAQVQVMWGLRFTPEQGGAEQILREQRSVFQFRRNDDGLWRLTGISGAAIFGVADREGKVQH